MFDARPGVPEPVHALHARVERLRRRARPGTPGGSRTATARPTARCRSAASRTSPSCRTRRTCGSTRWATASASAVPMGNGPTGWRPTAACATPPARAGSIYKQGDGRMDIHDWGMEFTAAGVVMQAELLLISRDPEAIAQVPAQARALSRTSSRSRRDPKNNLFLAGRGRQPAGPQLRRLEEARRHLRQGLPGRPVDHLHRRRSIG